MHALPDTFRAARALEDGTIVLAVGAKEGEAFTPRGWEEFYVAFALLAAGEPGQGREAMQDALVREPTAWQGQYNAACFEALAGDTDAALDHLRRALELNHAEVHEYAGSDDDLASIRTDPRYAELMR